MSEVLSKMEKEIQGLSKKLTSNIKKVRFEAAFALGRMQAEVDRVLPVLLEAIRDEDKQVRIEAVQVLGRIGKKTEQAVPVLIEALKDEEVQVRGHAAYLLGHIGKKAEPAVHDLIKALNDQDAYMRSNAAWALGRMSEEAKYAVPALMEELSKEEEPNVKYRLAFALTQIERKRGEGTRLIEEMMEKGELDEYKLKDYESLSQELMIDEVRDKIETQPEITTKEFMDVLLTIQESITTLKNDFQSRPQGKSSVLENDEALNMFNSRIIGETDPDRLKKLTEARKHYIEGEAKYQLIKEQRKPWFKWIREQLVPIINIVLSLIVSLLVIFVLRQAP